MKSDFKIIRGSRDYGPTGNVEHFSSFEILTEP
jgi:hypothetical protein